MFNPENLSMVSDTCLSIAQMAALNKEYTQHVQEIAAICFALGFIAAHAFDWIRRKYGGPLK